MRIEDAQIAIDRFLVEQQIVCRAEVDPPSTVFWSYPLSSIDCLGWISIYSDNEGLFIRATVNFGRIASPESQAFKVLLEANSSLCAMNYATELNTLVTIGFTEKLCKFDASSLHKRLLAVHEVAQASRVKFVNSQVGVEPLPKSWFESKVKS